MYVLNLVLENKVKAIYARLISILYIRQIKCPAMKVLE
jgi:hypothetical protein